MKAIIGIIFLLHVKILLKNVIYVYLKIKVINILPLSTNLILCDKPKELYVIDITEIPMEL